ncbi:hypothetical protein [Vibrio sp. 1F279]|uniref:hypothetical protein n=1 Tax=unclassified Vibrio TaxID=2614977 RepID=UPI00352DB408
MKLNINCMECFQEQGKPSLEFSSVEIRDDGLYSSTCSNGHSTITVIQEQKFEVLFDFGALALLDGYPREAVTSIAAALERFYEFYVAVTCVKHKVDYEKFLSTWKHVSNQSERQFGAYLFAYLMDHNGSEPPIIDESKPPLDGIAKKDIRTWKGFRNAVVHKGYIPSYVETVAYSNIVYLHIYELISDLQNRSGDALQKVMFHHIARANKAAEGKVVSTMSIPTLIRLARGEAPPESFELALGSIEKYRKWLHHV